MKSMICSQGFLYWIWGMLKNTNFLERRGRKNTQTEGGMSLRKAQPPPPLPSRDVSWRRSPPPCRSPRPLAPLSRRVVVHGHHLHRALEDDVALAEVLQRPPDGKPAFHRHGGARTPSAPPPGGSGGKHRPAPRLTGAAVHSQPRPREEFLTRVLQITESFVAPTCL